MAGYRPKSLDELNSIFDKTMAAEKAIKKGSSLLENREDGFSSFTPDTADESKKKPETSDSGTEIKPSEEISDSVSEFIAKFSAQTEPEPVKSKPQMTVLSPEPVVKHEEKAEEPVPEAEAEKTPAEADKTSRDDLFNDYARIIMSDDEDDFPAEKKLSRKEKKRLKKKEKAEVTVTEEPLPEITEDTPTEVNQEEAPAEIPAAEERDDFDFPENYTPEWMKAEEDDIQDTPETAPKKKKADKHTPVKVILSIILVILVSISALATVLKAVAAVNTGKLFADKYYVFTAQKDYSSAAISDGTLVVTEKKDVSDGEVFAYVDHASKSFEFGICADTISKLDGETVYVTEKDGGRTLVSQSDCRGVIHLTFESRGKAVDFLTDNYIIIISVSAVAALVIVLVFALVLKTKKEEEDSAGEETEIEQEFSEESEEDFEDIFSTIE